MLPCGETWSILRTMAIYGTDAVLYWTLASRNMVNITYDRFCLSESGIDIVLYYIIFF